MKYIIDTHLHIYPFYSIHQAVQNLMENLYRHAQQGVKVGCLTERYDCHVFDDLLDLDSSSLTQKFNITPSPSRGSIRIQSLDSTREIVLLPGQQIITAENIEILSLNCPKRVTEGATAQETVEQVLAAGGIPVIAFGFGKWLGKRGKIVSDLIDRYDHRQIAIGDTTMRPIGWTTPMAFRKARSKGIKILHGSDPLPFKGEEIRPGSYASSIHLDDPDPESAIKGILAADSQASPLGKRCSVVELARRMHKHRAQKAP